ncbi:MAG: sulfatase [Candidatus Coatesbacteria bacterium]|nr:sulfatase [Candidatus Coatesbacteria bacterium]
MKITRLSRFLSVLLVWVAATFVAAMLAERHKQAVQARAELTCCWNMIDSLEKCRIASTATASAILPFADVMTNNDSYLVANRWGMKKKVTIKEEQRSAVFAPSATSIECPVHVPVGGVLQFGYGIAPDAWSMPGDGCEFEITLEDGSRNEQLFSDYINPKMREGDRKWFDGRVDLARWAGKDVTLTFSTRGTYPISPPFSREPDVRYDYALWSNPFIARDDDWQRNTNLILISIDTVRADHVSCYGCDRNTTPNIDALAAESMLFEQAITPAPWTLPAHASLFTGLMPSEHGVQNFYQRLSDEALTLAEVLRARSFLTLGVASFDYLFPDYGLLQGFDEHFFRCPLRAEKVVEKALEMLDKHHGKRFFMFLHFFDAHDPYDPPSPWDRMFSPSGVKGRPKKEHKSPIAAFLGARRRPAEQDVEATIALYDGEIRFVDDQLSFLFARLKELGLWDNTMLVVLSDHGEEFWDHGSLSHGFRLYEEQIRVPLIVKLPFSRNAGERIERQAGLIDVAPTILAELGIEAEMTGPGRSLLSSQSPEPAELKEERYYVSETVAHGVKRLCLRTKALKYITPNCYNYKGLNYRSPELLYDLRNDPHETENLIAPEAGLTASLRKDACEHLFGLSSRGWQLLFSTPKSESEFSGRIKTEGRIRDVYSLTCLGETVAHDDHFLEFSKVVNTYESSLSFRVEPPDAPLTIEIKIDDSLECLDHILLGPRAEHPSSNPFGLTAEEATADVESLIVASEGRGQHEGVLIFYAPGSAKQPLKRSVGTVEIDARRREALKMLGYLR